LAIPRQLSSVAGTATAKRGARESELKKLEQRFTCYQSEACPERRDCRPSGARSAAVGMRPPALRWPGPGTRAAPGDCSCGAPGGAKHGAGDQGGSASAPHCESRAIPRSESQCEGRQQRLAPGAWRTAGGPAPLVGI